MNRWYISLLALLAMFAFTTPAYALLDQVCEGNHSCDTHDTDNSTTNEGGAGGTGYGGEGGEGGDASLGFLNDFGGDGGDGGSAYQGQGQGIYDSGNSKAYGGDVDDSGNSSVGNGFGNFSPDATAYGGDAEVDDSGNSDVRIGNSGLFSSGDTLSPSSDQDQNQGQGQDQGQGQSQSGINKQGQSSSTDTSTSTATDTSTEQSQSNSNSATGSGNDTDVNVDARDQSTTIHEAQERNPVNSAAPVFASACSSGMSAQGANLGAAVARTNPYCNLALTAETAAKHGNDEVADEMIELMAGMARSDAKGHGNVRGFLRGVPVLGGVFGWIW